MKKQVIFDGVGTALITPFKNGRIDFEALQKIIEQQIESKISALIIGGTTGEAATLSDFERYTLFEFAKEKTDGRVKLIFGTGTNDTRAAIRHTKKAAEIGCDGVLVVTPYYNKGTLRGVSEHYLSISESTDLPIILYNVPSRTGVNLTTEQLEALSKQENIVAIKEAGDSMDRYAALASMREDLGIYAGNDSHFFQVLSIGGLGVISVLSNAFPRLMNDIYTGYRNAEGDKALSLQSHSLGLISALFAETNPAPIKFLMNRLGFCENELRLPLAPISEKTERLIYTELENPALKKYISIS